MPEPRHTNRLKIIQNDETISTSSLVNGTAIQYGMTAEEYLFEMEQDNVWGGGPELIALSNSLSRQIVLLETIQHDPSREENTTYLKIIARLGPRATSRPIYVLFTNQRFPREYNSAKSNNHFLAVFPSYPF